VATLNRFKPADDILRVEDLYVDFQVRTRGMHRKELLHAVNGVTLSVPRGGTVGLVGESGSGKTTLTRAILRLEEVAKGRVFLDGEDITSMGARELRARRPKMQVVFQDPSSSLDPRATSHQIVAEPLRINHRYSPQRVSELLGQVGMQGADDLRPPVLSGGQKQRVAIARALALEPQLLILDEPVTSLDVSIRAQVMNLLVGLQEQLGLSYLFVGHDLAVVGRISQRIAVMYAGRIVEMGPAKEVFQRPLHPYTELLVSSVPVPDPDSRDMRRQTEDQGEMPEASPVQSACPFRARCPRAQHICSKENPPLVEHRLNGQMAACWFPAV